MLDDVTIFDYVVLIITTLSTLSAFLKGFLKTIISLISWTLAGFLTYISYQEVTIYMMKFISIEEIATLASIFSTYIVLLIIFSMISAKILDAIKPIKGGAIDHSLGFAFGLIRGVFICGIMFVCIKSTLLVWLESNKPLPKWLTNSQSYNLLDQTTNWGFDLMGKEPFSQNHNSKGGSESEISKTIKSLPENIINKISQDKLEEVIGNSQLENSNGYTKEQIKEIEKLIDTIE